MSNIIKISDLDNLLNILLIGYLLYSIFSFVMRNPFSILYIMIFMYISIIIYVIYSFSRNFELQDENQISFVFTDKPKFNDDDVSSIEKSDDLESDKSLDKKSKKKSNKKTLKKEINETKNQIKELKDLINSKFENQTTYSSPYSFVPYTYNYTSFSDFGKTETETDDVKQTSDEKEKDDKSEQILEDALSELISDNFEVVD
jgi:hypothetical protein